jgi:hypothetical protein
MSKIRFYFSYLFILSLLIGSCGSQKSNDNTQEIKAYEVVVGSPVKQKMTDYLNLNANTIYLKQEIIRATFNGYIEKVFKSIGDRINPGDVLFLIRTKESAAIDSLNINFGSSKFSGLVKITAKSSGIITELNHHVGDYVTEAEQLVLAVDPQSLRIMLNVPYQYSEKIKINSSYSLRLPDGNSSEAIVVRRMPSIDPVNQTETYLMELTGNKFVPSNLNVIVKIPLNTVNDALALPKSAVLTNETQSQFWVMKLFNDNTAIKVIIQKGIENDSLVQITVPKFDVADKFVIDGGYGLPDTSSIISRR